MSQTRTLRDPNQILSAEHDEDNNSKRVTIVAGEMPEFKMPIINMDNLKFPEFLKVEVPVIVTQTEVKIVEVPVPVITKEVQVIETQVVVVDKEIQVLRVEVPIVIKEFEVIEKPVIITEYKDVPKWIKVLLIAQALISIISLLKK